MRRSICPDALGEMGDVDASAAASGRGSTPVPYLRILRSYARYATPGRTRDQPTVPNIPRDRGIGPKNRNGRNSPAITLQSLVHSAGVLFPLDLHNFIGLGAARRDHLNLGALLFSNQGARERRGNGNLAFLSVRFRLADELPHRFFFGVFVD